MLHILYICEDIFNTWRACLTRKNLAKITLMPFLAPLFLIMWLVSYFGGRKAEAMSRQHVVNISRKTELETGLMAALAEDLEYEVPLTPEHTP